ncbi:MULTISPECIES: cupin domain-containing protein [unclassified Phaeobacter]|uniref:cupin domain-containing protein n=1 Tax=unclassified Phaeobacter TaxID=2621772 RepID=UPI003A843335
MTGKTDNTKSAQTSAARTASARSSDVVRHPFSDVARQLTEAAPFDVVFETPEVTVELYAPVGIDKQKPHERDELYIVATGTGTFSRGDQLVPFGPGDLLFVPAHVPHRFESFTDDFKVWVIFYGDVRFKETGAHPK